MALGINTNVASINAQNQLNSSKQTNSEALERLSSGLRINSAKDDAAGLAISTRFEAQISGQEVASRNANDGISYAQTAEGALDEVSNSLSRIRELSVQSANDTNSDSDREALDSEAQALIDEVNRISESTQFNNQNVLDGSLEDLQFQVGANAGQTIGVDGVDSRGSKLGSEVLEGESGISKSDIESLAGDNLTINGRQVDGTDVSSAQDLKAAINDISGDTGVEATDRTGPTEADLGAVSGPGDAEATLTINDTEISIASGASDGDIEDAINNVSDQTGVEASQESGDFTLTSEDGGEISVAVSGGGDTDLTFANVDGDSADSDETFYPGLDLKTDVGESFTIDSDESTDEATTSDIFGANGDVSGDLETKDLNRVDISSRDGASEAITTIDKALDQVNSTRADLGAVQSRFESTIANLDNSIENLSSANGRIKDADFAAESAKLSQSQVLQQAGISVLSQANQRPQQVLSLLQ